MPNNRLNGEMMLLCSEYTFRAVIYSLTEVCHSMSVLPENVMDVDEVAARMEKVKRLCALLTIAERFARDNML